MVRLGVLGVNPRRCGRRQMGTVSGSAGVPGGSRCEISEPAPVVQGLYEELPVVVAIGVFIDLGAVEPLGLRCREGCFTGGVKTGDQGAPRRAEVGNPGDARIACRKGGWGTDRQPEIGGCGSPGSSQCVNVESHSADGMTATAPSREERRDASLAACANGRGPGRACPPAAECCPPRRA